MLRKFLILTLFLITYHVLRIVPVFASDFAFDYVVTYDVSTNGTTHVTQNVKLTNLVSNYYAQNYTLSVNSQALENITAFDEGGTIVPEVTKSNGQTTMKLQFTTKTAGINKVHPFTLSYDSRDLATKKGRIWEIIIPGIEKNSDIRSYTAKLIVPKSFGKAAYFSPAPKDQNEWNLTQLGGRGITAAYGDYQSFSFNLIYYLENTSSRPMLQEITLPPDTEFQKIVLNRLSETPQNVHIDSDGNWLALFQLRPREIKKIIAEGLALIYISPGTQKTSLTRAEKSTYTSPQKFWEQTPEIKELANTLKTPQAIYDWVVNNLSYNYSRVEPGIKRLGAIEALKNPKNSVCMEFSDLFIALARSAGIPARQIHGYAYTTNSRLQPLSLLTDVLHAWPEYYDEEKRLWVPVDPTWGNTTVGVDYFSKLDFNHIAFAILGIHSNYPYPAGAFKLDEKSKDVFVDFTTLETIPEPQATLTIGLPPKLVAGGNTTGTIKIKNTGNVLFTPEKLEFSSEFPVSFRQENLTAIPPYGEIEVPIEVTTPFSFVSHVSPLRILLNHQETKAILTSAPLYEVYWWVLLIIGASFVLMLLFRHAKRGPQSYH